MKIDRYLFFAVLRPSILSLGFYTFVLFMNQLFVIARQALQRGTSLATVLEILGLGLPKIFVLTVPMAILLGVMIGIGRLSSDSEVIALRAAGVSYYRMARPILALGVVGFLLTAGVYSLVVPWANGQMYKVRTQLIRTSDPNREIRPRVFFDSIPGAILYAEDVNPQSSWPLRKMFLYLERGPEGQQVFVCGARGRIEHLADLGRLGLVIERGEIHTTEPARPEAYKTIPFEGPFRQIMVFEDGVPNANRRKGIDEHTLPELLAEIDRIRAVPGWRSDPTKSIRYRRAVTELNHRFSLPFASVAFALVAFPLGFVNPRAGRASGFTLSLLIIIGYWIALRTGGELARDGRIPIVLGTWGPDLMILGAAALFYAARRRIESMSFPELARKLTAVVDRWVARGRARKALRSVSWLDEEASSERRSARLRLSIVDRYLSRRFLMIFSYVLLTVFTLYAVVQMNSLLDPLLEQKLPLTLGLSYLVYYAPGMLKILLPVAAVMAALVTLGAVCRSNEDTALKSAGISVFRIASPLMVVTCLLSAGYFLVQDYVVPYSNKKASKILDRIEGRTTSTIEAGARWVLGKDHRLYSYADYDAAKRTLQDVTTIELAADTFTVRRRMWAQRVAWDGGRWVARQGWLRTFDHGREIGYTVLSNAPLSWPEVPEDFDRQERSLLGSGRLAEEMNFMELRRHIKRMRHSGYDTTSLRVSLYEKLAFPAAPIVMLLLGVPFAFRAGRRGSLYGVGIALFLVVLYWASFAVSSALGQEGILPPALAAFSPDLLFALVGGYFFLSTRS